MLVDPVYFVSARRFARHWRGSVQLFYTFAPFCSLDTKDAQYAYTSHFSTHHGRIDGRHD